MGNNVFVATPWVQKCEGVGVFISMPAHAKNYDKVARKKKNEREILMKT